MTNIKQATAILTVLKEMGLRLPVDDFGTGYSSLAHLHRLPPFVDRDGMYQQIASFQHADKGFALRLPCLHDFAQGGK